ncbi:hypothetical protein [Modestobacter sp. NPDC049651]|uniref:hypothetical protein n=1 Tax=unclassified Modestobacter TaxID=2643866 RepID=UPI0033C3E310
MLSKTCYDQEDVAACRARLASHLEAWHRLPAGGVPELAEFEPVFFNRLVIELDHTFAQRTRPPAGRPADASVEVRVLAGSLVCDGRLAVDRTVRWCPERTVLRYRPGDEIAVREADFTALSKAFLTELETLVV